MRNIYLLTLILLFTNISCSNKANLVRYNEGITEYKNMNYDKALKIFDEGIKMNNRLKYPNYYGKARCFYEIGDFDQAIMEINNCLSGEKYLKDNFLSNVYLMKGLIESELNEKELEIQSYQKGIEFDRTNVELLVTYGYSLNEKEKYVEAIKVLDEAILINKELSYAYNKIGQRH